MAFGCLLGLSESLAIYEVWSIDPSAGFFGMLEFAVFRALMFWVFGRCLKVHQASPWLLGGLWSLCEAVHAALPFTVPNVIGEIFIDSPLRSLIGWFGAWGLSGWLVGSMGALLSRDRCKQRRSLSRRSALGSWRRRFLKRAITSSLPLQRVRLYW